MRGATPAVTLGESGGEAGRLEVVQPPFRGGGDHEIGRWNTAVVSAAGDGELDLSCSAPHVSRHCHGIEGAEVYELQSV